MSNLYNNIENQCAARGVTITQMCKEAGVSRASLSDLKMGRTKMLGADKLNKIAAYFGTSVDQLLGNESPRQDVLEQVDVAFYGEYKELDEQEKDVVREMVRQLRRRREEKGQE